MFAAKPLHALRHYGFRRSTQDRCARGISVVRRLHDAMDRQREKARASGRLRRAATAPLVSAARNSREEFRGYDTESPVCGPAWCATGGIAEVEAAEGGRCAQPDSVLCPSFGLIGVPNVRRRDRGAVSDAESSRALCSRHRHEEQVRQGRFGAALNSITRAARDPPQSSRALLPMRCAQVSARTWRKGLASRRTAARLPHPRPLAPEIEKVEDIAKLFCCRFRRYHRLWRSRCARLGGACAVRREIRRRSARCGDG